MDISPYLIVNSSLYTVIVGMILGVTLDILSLVEIYIKNLVNNKLIPWTVYFTKDLLSIITFTVFLVISLYYFNNGEFRGLLALALISGLLIYRCTIGKMVRLILNTCVRIVQKILGFLLQPIAKLCLRMYNKSIRNRST